MNPESGGYHSLYVVDAGASDRYLFQAGTDFLPDPASRFQPDGTETPSEIIDPTSFRWTDRDWRGAPLRGAVLYEMHVGTFTPEGTWRAAMEKLPGLVDLGVTALEVMPVAEFPGRFGWGYDGVHPYAPTRLYGRPDDFKAFVDRAHALGLAVLLDVVYNHLGPDGCVFRRFARGYFSTTYRNEWGDPMNFDGPDCGPVREFFISNAAYWIEEYHLDGLRLDATQSLHDASSPHIIAEIERTVRRSGRGRATLLVSENEPQKILMVRSRSKGGYGLDALWNDDFHHSAIVALTGRGEAYYTDHRGAPQEFISAAKYGCLFQGQRYAWQRQPRGTPAHGIPPETFVLFIENHDQLANSGGGVRLHLRTSPGRMRAMTALMLLMPGTPMLFQGQEFASTRPFLYFADHKPDLARNVEQGRNTFLAQFPSLASPEMRPHLAAPHDPSTFERCRLDWSEREAHPEAVALHADLLRMRREDAAFRRQAPGGVDGAVLGPESLALRFQTERDAEARLLIVNFGSDLAEDSIAEPLLAPPEGTAWGVLWSSEDPRYGGAGTPPVAGEDGWRVPGHSAIVLAPETRHEGQGKKAGA
jgi:maltooligosyltrehalose trehalohydrolase